MGNTEEPTQNEISTNNVTERLDNKTPHEYNNSKSGIKNDNGKYVMDNIVLLQKHREKDMNIPELEFNESEFEEFKNLPIRIPKTFNPIMITSLKLTYNVKYPLEISAECNDKKSSTKPIQYNKKIHCQNFEKYWLNSGLKFLFVKNRLFPKSIVYDEMEEYSNFTSSDESCRNKNKYSLVKNTSGLINSETVKLVLELQFTQSNCDYYREKDTITITSNG